MYIFELLFFFAIIYILLNLLKRGSGEGAVSHKIESLAKRNSEYHSFNNIILETSDGTTQIDQILISPYGIFVIETKDFKGWIFGNAYQKQWTQSLFTRSFGFFRNYTSIKYKFQNPLHQNYKHVKAVQKFLDVDIKLIFSIVVFTGDGEFKTNMPNNVVRLGDFSSHLESYTEQILSSESIERFSQKLSNYLEHSSINESDHIKNIEQNLINPICPRCGKPMIIRIAKKGPSAGSEFWGCSNYPSCKAIKNLA